TVALGEFPNGSGRPKPEDDRFWETALEIGMRLSPHASFGDRTPPPVSGASGTGGQEFAAAMCQRANIAPMYTIAQLLLAGVFDRFPELHFYFAETNAGWMPEA